MIICDIVGCKRPVSKLGFCYTHYLDWREHNPPGKPRRKLKAGPRNPIIPLTDDQIRAIRKKYKRGKNFQREIGAEYGISQSRVSRITMKKERGDL